MRPSIALETVGTAWYFKLMCFSGARAGSVRVKWADVDFTNRQIVIGADGNTKNGKSRVVDFNGELEALLLEMRDSRLSDEWLFVSGQREVKDGKVL